MIDQEIVANRRRADRHRLNIAVDLRTWGSSIVVSSGKSIDISSTGALLETNLPAPIGAFFDLRLKLPEEITGQPTTEWHCKGRVVRVAPPRSIGYLRRVGVHFDWLDGFCH